MTETVVNIPWVPIFGSILSGLVLVIVFFVREIGLHFKQQVVEIKQTVEGLITEMNSLTTAIKTEAVRREGESKRIDEIHEEIHTGPNCIRNRLHDLENFQTAVEIEKGLNDRRGKRDS